MRRHYVVICMPLASGGWRAIVPDAHGYEVKASSLDQVVTHARFDLASYVASLNGNAREILPLSRGLIEITSDEQWIAANAIDWPGAVITMIPLSV